jgi:small-conductance mechanosensitive channel
MLIPNGSFLEKNVTNWTLSVQRLRFTVTCRVAYRSVVRHVIKLLRRAVDEHRRIRQCAVPDPRRVDGSGGANRPRRRDLRRNPHHHTVRLVSEPRPRHAFQPPRHLL